MPHVVIDSPTGRPTDASHKALHLNLDPEIYGSIAEIGAGQEVARHFFRVGGAAGTVAKTLSAYDMKVSDAIYGKESSGRYVSRPRLESMLRREFELTVERVAAHRPATTRYFAFADTVAAKAYKSDRDCHGWMGIVYQHAPQEPPSKIVLHVRMLDRENKEQQEALGALGVNLIYAAFHSDSDSDRIVDTLGDGLGLERLEINFIEFSGPAFAHVDNVLANLRLVTARLAQVIMFDAAGVPQVTSELLHHKHLVLLRGTFRPFLSVHQDMLARGKAAFCAERDLAPETVLSACEMNLSSQLAGGADIRGDLAERVADITARGYPVMVSGFLRYFRVSEYFTRFDRREIGFIVTGENILTILDDRYYESMQGKGGMLEAMGKLFSSGARLFVYPMVTPEGAVITGDTLVVPDKYKYLYKHLLYNRQVIPLPADTVVPYPDVLR